MPKSVSTPESKIKKLQIKYAHERDALAWAFDKAFEVAQEERDVDTVDHLSTLGKLAKQYDIGIDNWQRWEALRDEIEETAKTEDFEDGKRQYAELAGDIERDEK